MAVMRETGAVVLRNVFSENQLSFLVNEVHRFMAKPSIAGSFGYYKKDHNKRFVDPFQIGGEAVQICLHESLIDFVESYMESPCVLSEAFVKEDAPSRYVYFPLHSDYAPGSGRRLGSRVTTEDDMRDPIAVGAALYLAETHEGAFCYCLGSHKLGAPRGQNLSDYPKDEQVQIRSTLRRFDGDRGDIVLFDDRGFHGPDQPSSKTRLVMLLDWFRLETWGQAYQVAPISVFTSDLGRLSKKQLRVLGAGATPLGPRETYHMHKFGRGNSGMLAFRLARILIDNAHISSHVRKTVRARLRRLRRPKD